MKFDIPKKDPHCKTIEVENTNQYHFLLCPSLTKVKGERIRKMELGLTKMNTPQSMQSMIIEALQIAYDNIKTKTTINRKRANHIMFWISKSNRITKSTSRSYIAQVYCIYWQPPKETPLPSIARGPEDKKCHLTIALDPLQWLEGLIRDDLQLFQWMPILWKNIVIKYCLKLYWS